MSVLSGLAESYRSEMSNMLTFALQCRFILLSPPPLTIEQVERMHLRKREYDAYMTLRDVDYSFSLHRRATVNPAPGVPYSTSITVGPNMYFRMGTSSSFSPDVDSDEFTQFKQWTKDSAATLHTNNIAASYCDAALKRSDTWPQLMRACPPLPRTIHKITTELMDRNDTFVATMLSFPSSTYSLRQFARSVDETIRTRTHMYESKPPRILDIEGFDETPRQIYNVTTEVLSQLLLLIEGMKTIQSHDMIALPLHDGRRCW